MAVYEALLARCSPPAVWPDSIPKMYQSAAQGLGRPDVK